MYKKVLSIAVPSYNAAHYLEETIPTMLSLSNLSDLEILIVNDGSTDNTLEVAEKLRVKFPNVIKVINKENGGHGSTINAAIPEATGKYFKVIDADDWVVSENLASLINYLKNCDDDEVISPYFRVFEDTGKKEEVTYSVANPKISYEYEHFLKEVQEIPEMHSKTTKTEILKASPHQIDENCFYVDMEFIVFSMPFIKSISYFNKPVYCYRLGTINQSVNINNYIKNEHMHKRVLLRLIDFYHQESKNLEGIREVYLIKLISRMVSTHYNIILAKKISKQSKQELIDLDKLLVEKEPKVLLNSVGRKVKLIRATRYFAYWSISKIEHLKLKN